MVFHALTGHYEQQQWLFKQRITAVCGSNGSGKTNLLDAIYYLCFTKSYFSRQDAQIVQHGKSGLRVDGVFLKDEKEQEEISLAFDKIKSDLLSQIHKYEIPKRIVFVEKIFYTQNLKLDRIKSNQALHNQVF